MNESETRPPSNRHVVRIYQLGEERRDDLSTPMTAAERFELVRELTLRMTEFSGASATPFSMADMPVRFTRP